MEDVGDADNLAGWTVVVNGRRMSQATLAVRDGFFVVGKSGLAAVIR